MKENNKEIKVAVIGVGNMGKHHARVYSSLRGVKLVAVSDKDERRGKKIASQFHCKYYKNYQEMFANEKLDAVSIVVPTKCHTKVAKDALNWGINVLVEKPIALNLREAAEIIDAAKKNNKKLTVGHIERFNPAVRKLKKMITEGRFGNIISVLAKRVGPFAPQIDNDILIDLAVHDIDIINFLLEKYPTSMHVNGGRAINNSKEDYAEIFLKYGPISGYVQVNWITPVVIRELHVTGTKGYAKLNYITQELDFYKAKYKTEYDDYGDFVIKFGTPKKIGIAVKKEEPLKLELESFLNAVKQDKIPEVMARDGVKALEIALKALNRIKNA